MDYRDDFYSAMGRYGVESEYLMHSQFGYVKREWINGKWRYWYPGDLIAKTRQRVNTTAYNVSKAVRNKAYNVAGSTSATLRKASKAYLKSRNTTKNTMEYARKAARAMGVNAAATGAYDAGQHIMSKTGRKKAKLALDSAIASVKYRKNAYNDAAKAIKSGAKKASKLAKSSGLTNKAKYAARMAGQTVNDTAHKVSKLALSKSLSNFSNYESKALDGVRLSKKNGSKLDNAKGTAKWANGLAGMIGNLPGIYGSEAVANATLKNYKKSALNKAKAKLDYNVSEGVRKATNSVKDAFNGRDVKAARKRRNKQMKNGGWKQASILDKGELAKRASYGAKVAGNAAGNAVNSIRGKASDLAGRLANEASYQATKHKQNQAKKRRNKQLRQDFGRKRK